MKTHQTEKRCWFLFLNTFINRKRISQFDIFHWTVWYYKTFELFFVWSVRCMMTNGNNNAHLFCQIIEFHFSMSQEIQQTDKELNEKLVEDWSQHSQFRSARKCHSWAKINTWMYQFKTSLKWNIQRENRTVHKQEIVHKKSSNIVSIFCYFVTSWGCQSTQDLNGRYFLVVYTQAKWIHKVLCVYFISDIISPKSFQKRLESEDINELVRLL